MTLQEIIDFLQPFNMRVVAKEVGIHYDTLIKLMNGTTANPSYETVKRLEAYCLAKKGK